MKSKKLKQLIATVMIATTVAATVPTINPIAVFASSDVAYTSDQATAAGFTFSPGVDGSYQITDYRKPSGGSTALIIPYQINGKSVTSIGDSAFRSCSDLTSITIPNSVTSIGDSAFGNCSSLTLITIPNSVTSIGDSAFSNCSSLTSITIPNSVTSIGSYEFYNCMGLTSITISDSATSIGSFALYGCSNLTSITIPHGVTSIGDHAFLGCIGLTSITIPDSVTSIGINAFGTCTGLTSITIPDSVTSIDRSAFSNCTGLTSIAIPNSITSISDSAFTDCSGLTSITIPDSVTSIDNSAFSGCSGLTSITIPNGVTSIGNSAFSGCSGLTSITIPDTAISIGANAFDNCSNLPSITIPNGATSIGMFTFTRCSNLTSITIPSSVTSIGMLAFSGCSNLTSITIPSSVTSIDMLAFNSINNKAIFYVPDLTIAEEVKSYKTGNIQIILPVALTLGQKTATTATVSFPAQTGATSVKLQQSADRGTTWSDAATGTLDATSTSATVTGLTASTSYKFRLVMNDAFYGSSLDVTTDTAVTPAYTVSASAASSSPVAAGATSAITLTVKDSNGNTDTTFSGLKNVTISGYTSAPNGTYGSCTSINGYTQGTLGIPPFFIPGPPMPIMGGGQLTATSTTISVNFTNGVATTNLALNDATAQNVVFNIDGVSTPATNAVTITSVPNTARSIELTQDITAPTANGGQFANQPKVTIKDAYGNICVNDNSTQVTVVKNDGGIWDLTGTTTKTVSGGVTDFNDLGATNAAAVTGAKLAFSATGCPQIISGTVNLPASEILGTLNPSAEAGNAKVTLSAESPESGYDYYYTKGGSSATAPSVNDNINIISGAQTFTTDTDIEGANGTAIYVQVYKVETATGKVKAYGETSATPAAPASTPAYTVAASTGNSPAIAGAYSEVTLTVKDSNGNIDTNFNGIKAVTVSGYTAAPDGSYGTLNYNTQITQAPTTKSFNFSNGVATLNLRLTNAAEQNIVFSVEGVNTPDADIISITPVPATAQTETLTQDITAPSSNGGRFAQQPIVTIKDLYGNICTNDSTTQVYVSKFGEGDWTLTGTTRATVNNGIARFDDLGATNEAAVTAAQLEFSLGDVGISSGSVNLPAPAARPAINGVLVTPSTARVAQGNTEQLTATVSAVGGADRTVTWSSSDSKVTVDSNGLVTVASDATPGDYIITATSTVDSSKKGTATITVTAEPVAPSITTDPSNKSITAGDSTSFTVSASGSSLTYQWQVDKNDGNGFVNVNNDSIYSGATSDNLSITGATTSMSGYKYRVIAGSLEIESAQTSSAATLTVNQPETNEISAISVDSISNIHVANGTDISDLNLPGTVTIDLSNNTTTSAEVTWDYDGADYDGNVAGRYRFTGALGLPDGVTNPDNLKASVNVIVAAAANQTTSASVTVTYVEPENIHVDNGTDISDLNLPETVTIDLSNNTTTSAAVSWNYDSADYDGDREGTYRFVGEFELPDGVTNPNNLQASTNVIVGKANTNTIAVPSGVRIEGTPKVGDILTAQLIGEDGNAFTTSATVTYKWYRLDNSNSEFSHEIGTGKTYKLTSDDVDKYIGVRAKYEDVSFNNKVGKILKNASNNSSSSSSHKHSNSSTTSSTSSTKQIAVNVTDGTSHNTISQTVIEQTAASNGTKTDKVTYTADKARETISALASQGKDTARIVAADSDSAVSETQVNIPNDTLSALSSGNVNLEIETNGAIVSVPKEGVQDLAANGQLNGDLYFRVVPIKDEVKQAGIKTTADKEAAVKAVAGNDGVQVLGTPMTIETNIGQRPVDITLPLTGINLPTDPAQRQAFLNDLGIFIEHSDGEKVLEKGTVVDYGNGVYGLKFRTPKFSDFTIVKLNENTKVKAGWKFDNGSWYFIKNDGTMEKGWHKSGNGEWTYDGQDTVGQWFHLDADGKLTTGWLKDTDGNWYYLCDGSDYGALGVMKTGWQRIDSKWYYFNSNGTMASDTVIDGYALGNDGALI